MARIALDAMGGDHAPHAAVAGALLALDELPSNHRIQLVGLPEVVEATRDSLLNGEFSAHRAHAERLEIVAASQVIDMSEKPSAVLRGKANSSMHVGLRLQTSGDSDAFVSAGNTGAQMAISLLVLRLHEGLSRPAIATLFPTSRRPVIVLDSGANVDCSAEDLVQFARLGAVYAEDILGRPNPVIGLLNIGEEPEKGSLAVKEAHQRLQTSGLAFLGNIEGRDLPEGANAEGPFDVVVCDGFVGNVLLKFYEGVGPMLFNLVSKHTGVSREQLNGVFRDLDYSEHGGAPLLGVRGVSIIAHGKSDARAIKNAIAMAVRSVDTKMSDHIARRLSGGVEASS